MSLTSLAICFQNSALLFLSSGSFQSKAQSLIAILSRTTFAFDNNHQLLATIGLSSNELSIFSIPESNTSFCNFFKTEFSWKTLEGKTDLEYFSKFFILFTSHRESSSSIKFPIFNFQSFKSHSWKYDLTLSENFPYHSS
jgi:hypothetical protein